MRGEGDTGRGGVWGEGDKMRGKVIQGEVE